MEKLVVSNLCKCFEMKKTKNMVLDKVNLEVKKGEMVAVMGPSGSGKSTLLYAISGMDAMTSGSVDFFGKDISRLSANQMSDIRLNEMGFIFQQMHMLSNLSIYDNIILPAYQSKKEKNRAKINERAQELMKKMGIWEIKDHDINEVSGGQLQRACICRSLINNPKVIFGDEPTGALNQQNSREVMEELTRINQEGTTIFLVTHDSRVASRCLRVIYFEDGNIKGEHQLGSYNPKEERKRELEISSWLADMGW